MDMTGPGLTTALLVVLTVGAYLDSTGAGSPAGVTTAVDVIVAVP